MSQLNFIVLSASLLAMCLHAEIKINENSAIGFGLDAGVQATSNVSLDSSETSDTIFRAMPTVNYRLRGASALDAFAGVEFLRYDELSNNDAENFKSGVTVKIPDETSSENYGLTAKAGFNEITSARSALQQVVQLEELNLSLAGTYFFDEYTSLRTGASYLDSISKTAGFVDVETIEVPLAVYYKYDEALSMGLGYQYRTTDIANVQPEADSNDHAAFFGIEDLVSPLVQYEVKVGYQYRDFDGDVFDDGGGFYAQATLTWYVAEITQVVASVSNEFGTSAANQSSETFSTTVTLLHQFNERIAGSLTASYQDIYYDQVVGDRSDDEYGLSLGVAYTLIPERFSLRGGVSFADHGSDAPTANYEVLEATISCVLLF